MLFRLLLLAFCASCFAACATTNTSTAASDRQVTRNTAKVSIDQGTDLTEFIRRLPGVQVMGGGGDASIIVRGVSTINGSSDPLLVVDGQIFGTDYSALYGALDVTQIDQVQVLKDAADLAMYGVQGANGVIVVNMKQ
ncbi:MAG: TonB-dependent receptor plug domain-containing protein [Bacteroidota bacterium]